MLKELPCKQIDGEPLRRWLCDDYFDLIIWCQPGGTEFIGFQLCYDKPGQERALTWNDGRGFRHSGISSGDTGPFSNCTPVLVPGAISPPKKLPASFSGVAQKWIPKFAPS